MFADRRCSCGECERVDRGNYFLTLKLQSLNLVLLTDVHARVLQPQRTCTHDHMRTRLRDQHAEAARGIDSASLAAWIMGDTHATVHCGSIRNRVRSCGLCFRVRSRARETVTVGRFIPVTCKVRHMILYRSTIEAQHAHKGTLRNQHMRGKTRITRLRRFARFAASAPNPRRRSCCQRAVRARWSAHLSARLIAASRLVHHRRPRLREARGHCCSRLSFCC